MLELTETRSGSGNSRWRQSVFDILFGVLRARKPYRLNSWRRGNGWELDWDDGAQIPENQWSALLATTADHACASGSLHDMGVVSHEGSYYRNLWVHRQ